MNPAINPPVNPGFTILHVVSIAGCVREQPDPLAAAAPPAAPAVPPALDPAFSAPRLGGALVEIISGPPAYEALRARQAAALAAGTRLRRPRCDRTYSQADGIYYFTDLPPGDYMLRAGAPQHGTRYGTAATEAPLQVLPRPDPGPVPVPGAIPGPISVSTFDAWLPTTGLRGIVRRQDTGDPIFMAQVRLRGEPAPLRTDVDGRYALRRLPAGRHSFEITAPGFTPVQQAVTLERGKEVIIPDILLQRL